MKAAEHFYGQRLHANPIIEGQFENESWLSRLLKEFILRTGYCAAQVGANLASESISRVRWAPKKQ